MIDPIRIPAHHREIIGYHPASKVIAGDNELETHAIFWTVTPNSTGIGAPAKHCTIWLLDHTRVIQTESQAGELESTT
ncbi:hypothetical protein IEQ34_016655 [Dendrobium chrysotoxum]|uniref:Uncharacterized protein n=1 Tax=Dendrobium chrysotoxum TaxID=161865 RepID=A0AAV7GF60_DENCH|nr:hypothetical protein IEQ34_016655 [Dendrobium chrysotoxum]